MKISDLRKYLELKN